MSCIYPQIQDVILFIVMSEISSHRANLSRRWQWEVQSHIRHPLTLSQYSGRGSRSTQKTPLSPPLS